MGNGEAKEAHALWLPSSSAISVERWLQASHLVLRSEKDGFFFERWWPWLVSGTGEPLGFLNESWENHVQTRPPCLAVSALTHMLISFQERGFNGEPGWGWIALNIETFRHLFWAPKRPPKKTVMFHHSRAPSRPSNKVVEIKLGQQTPVFLHYRPLAPLDLGEKLLDDLGSTTQKPFFLWQQIQRNLWGSGPNQNFFACQVCPCWSICPSLWFMGRKVQSSPQKCVAPFLGLTSFMAAVAVACCDFKLCEISRFQDDFSCRHCFLLFSLNISWVEKCLIISDHIRLQLTEELCEFSCCFPNVPKFDCPAISNIRARKLWTSPAKMNLSLITGSQAGVGHLAVTFCFRFLLIQSWSTQTFLTCQGSKPFSILPRRFFFFFFVALRMFFSNGWPFSVLFDMFFWWNSSGGSRKKTCFARTSRSRRKRCWPIPRGSKRPWKRTTWGATLRRNKRFYWLNILMGKSQTVWDLTFGA